MGPLPDFSSPAIAPNRYELQPLNAPQQETDRLADILNSEAGLDRAIAESRQLFQVQREKSIRYKEAVPGGSTSKAAKATASNRAASWLVGMP